MRDRGLLRLIQQVRLSIGIALLTFAGAGFLSMLPGRLLVLLFVLALGVTLVGLRSTRTRHVNVGSGTVGDYYRRVNRDDHPDDDDNGLAGSRIPRRPSPTSPAATAQAVLTYDDRDVRANRPSRDLLKW